MGCRHGRAGWAGQGERIESMSKETAGWVLMVTAIPAVFVGYAVVSAGGWATLGLVTGLFVGLLVGVLAHKEDETMRPSSWKW